MLVKLDYISSAVAFPAQIGLSRKSWLVPLVSIYLFTHYIFVISRKSTSTHVNNICANVTPYP